VIVGLFGKLLPLPVVPRCIRTNWRCRSPMAS